MTQVQTDRRHFLKSMISSAALGIGLSAAQVQNAWAQVSDGDVETSLNMDYIRALVDTILPKTDTPSATEVGAHDFVAFMYEKGLDAADRVNFDKGLTDLQAKSNAQYGANFEKLDPKLQHLLLTQEDLESLRLRNFFAAPILADGEAPIEGKPFFYRLKALVIVGYFTSEDGINAHFEYDTVPGYFDGDEPYSYDQKGNYRDYIYEQILLGV